MYKLVIKNYLDEIQICAMTEEDCCVEDSFLSKKEIFDIFRNIKYYLLITYYLI